MAPLGDPGGFGTPPPYWMMSALIGLCDRFLGEKATPSTGGSPGSSTMLQSLEPTYNYPAISTIRLVARYSSAVESLRINRSIGIDSPIRQPSPFPGGPQPDAGEQESAQVENNRQQLIAKLSEFVQANEIPTNAKEGIESMCEYLRLKQYKLTPGEGRQLNQAIFNHLLEQLLLPANVASCPPESIKISAVEGFNRAVEANPPDLDPRIYTSMNLADMLKYSDSTMRRKAMSAWERNGGTGPVQLEARSDWYVVEAPAPGGGSRCGWKFQRLRKSVSI